MTDPYLVLGINRSATDEEIKKAYRNLSRKYHPDANVNNPNKAYAEEKFKEVQQAYEQIMKEKQNKGYYGGGFYGDGHSGGRYSGGSYREGSRYAYGEESPQMQAAANYIYNRCFREAINVLNQITPGERSARWYYYSAVANQGFGNITTAMEHAKKAVDLEPSNLEYRQLLQYMEYGGTWYTEMGKDYQKPYSGYGNFCLSALFLNLFCNCCCRPF